MAKQLTPEEKERIEKLEKGYSPENIRLSNEYLRVKTRLARVEQWRREALRDAETKLNRRLC